MFSLFFGLLNFGQVDKLFAFLIVWAGAGQSGSPGAGRPARVRVCRLPVGVDGLASLGWLAGPSTPTGGWWTRAWVGCSAPGDLDCLAPARTVGEIDSLFA